MTLIDMRNYIDGKLKTNPILAVFLVSSYKLSTATLNEPPMMNNDNTSNKQNTN
jgi:hypothetical protein